MSLYPFSITLSLNVCHETKVVRTGYLTPPPTHTHTLLCFLTSEKAGRQCLELPGHNKYKNEENLKGTEQIQPRIPWIRGARFQKEPWIYLHFNVFPHFKILVERGIWEGSLAKVNIQHTVILEFYYTRVHGRPCCCCHCDHCLSRDWWISGCVWKGDEWEWKRKKSTSFSCVYFKESYTCGNTAVRRRKNLL